MENCEKEKLKKKYSGKMWIKKIRRKFFWKFEEKNIIHEIEIFFEICRKFNLYDLG